jgi:hypothetical protein
VGVGGTVGLGLGEGESEGVLDGTTASSPPHAAVTIASTDTMTSAGMRRIQVMLPAACLAAGRNAG